MDDGVVTHKKAKGLNPLGPKHLAVFSCFIVLIMQLSQNSADNISTIHNRFQTQILNLKYQFWIRAVEYWIIDPQNSELNVEDYSQMMDTSS